MDTLERTQDETSFNQIPYEVRPIPADSPAISVMRAKFFENYGLKLDVPNPKLTWFGIFNKVSCLVIFALGVRADGGVEGTDFYVLPTKEGVKAADWALKMACDLIDHNVAPYFYMWVLGANKSMRKRVEKAFDVQGPKTVMYSYGIK